MTEEKNDEAHKTDNNKEYKFYSNSFKLFFFFLIQFSETSEGFSFGSINYSSAITTDNDKKEAERTYVVGHHGKKLQMPRKEDIIVVERK